MTTQIDNKELWDKCVEFHGHECGGLTIGFKAALYAIELLGIEFSKDEELVCVSENDACGIDAIQVILSCTAGKGNLRFYMTGKQAFSFYNRKTGESVRLVLKPRPAGLTREGSFDYYQNLEPSKAFDVKETVLEVPDEAKIFESFICENCGESAGLAWVREVDGKKLCIDCAEQGAR